MLHCLRECVYAHGPLSCIHLCDRESAARLPRRRPGSLTRPEVRKLPCTLSWQADGGEDEPHSGLYSDCMSDVSGSVILILCKYIYIVTVFILKDKLLPSCDRVSTHACLSCHPALIVVRQKAASERVPGHGISTRGALSVSREKKRHCAGGLALGKPFWRRV